MPAPPVTVQRDRRSRRSTVQEVHLPGHISASTLVDLEEDAGSVVARLRRTSQSFEEASADLGASGLQTFRFVVLPILSTALIAGGLLAFALSFDEVVVTFTGMPGVEVLTCGLTFSTDIAPIVSP